MKDTVLTPSIANGPSASGLIDELISNLFVPVICDGSGGISAAPLCGGGGGLCVQCGNCRRPAH